MTGKLLKSTCPACGAPVSRADHQKGFTCQFCGTEFYPEGGSNSRLFPETPISKPLVEFSNGDTPLDQPSEKKRFTGLWVGLGIFFSIILLLSFTGLINNNSSSFRLSSPTEITRPLMLSTLPKAESAGEAVAFNNFELVMDPNFRTSENMLYFYFTIQNWNGQVTVLRYKPNNFIVYDDLGNTYPLSLGYCDMDLPFFDRQVEFDAHKKITFESSNSWCNRDDLIPTYSGVIPAQAKHIYFHIDEFGVFKDITFVFDL